MCPGHVLAVARSCVNELATIQRCSSHTLPALSCVCSLVIHKPLRMYPRRAHGNLEGNGSKFCPNDNLSMDITGGQTCSDMCSETHAADSKKQHEKRGQHGTEQNNPNSNA